MKRFVIAVSAAAGLAWPVSAARAAESEALDEAFQRARVAIEEAARPKPRSAPRAEEIVIFHTNDIHGALFPSKDPATGAPRGGAASLAGLLKSETRPWLWIDSGDWFAGTPEGDLSRGEIVVDAFNRLGLSAAALGNHEFDHGVDNLRRLVGAARFPVLAANLGGAAGGSLALPYVIREAGGVKIGILGLVTASTSRMSFSRNVEGAEFGRESAAAEAAASELRRRGCDVVIAATHVGIEKAAGRVYEGIGEGDLFLAGGQSRIDLILGGHTHTELPEPVLVKGSSGWTTMITQTGGNLGSVYRIVLRPGAAPGRRASAELIALHHAAYPPDPATVQWLDRRTAEIREWVDRPFARAPAELSRSLNGESPLHDWVMDIFRAWLGTDVAVVGAFGVRSSVADGPLTYRALFQALPFNNRLVAFGIKGSDLRRVVERQAARNVLLLRFSGVQYDYDGGSAEGARVSNVRVDGVPLDPERMYTVATDEYTAAVDANLKDVPKRGLRDLGVSTRDLVVEAHAKAGMIVPVRDGRVSPAAAGSRPSD